MVLNLKAQEEFVLTHIGEICEASSLLKSTLQSIQGSVNSIIDQHPELANGLHCKKASWFGLPTTILYNKDETLEVALFARTSLSDHMRENDQLNTGKYIFIQIHIHTTESELTLESLNEKLAQKPYHQWYAKCVKYFRWPVTSVNIDDMTQELVETYTAINGLNPVNLK